MGILFPDIISLNFSMIIDPDGIRPIGKGDELSTIVMFPLCQHTRFNNYPSNASEFVACGGVSTKTLIANVPGKYNSPREIFIPCFPTSLKFQKEKSKNGMIFKIQIAIFI